MRLRVIVKAGNNEMATAVVSDRDPGTDVAQMLRSVLQLYRDANGALSDLPVLTITVAEIADNGGA